MRIHEFKNKRIDITGGQVLEVTAVMMGIIGATLCAYQDAAAYILWGISNPIFLYFTIKRREYWMSLVWICYLTTTIIGLITWN